MKSNFPFLTLNGTSEAAMSFYVSTFPNARITSLEYFTVDDPNGDTGKVQNGLLSVGPLQIGFLDMPTSYPAPAPNWATSFMLECDSKAEFQTIFDSLSTDGSVMMGPEPVYDWQLATWVIDKFGITWQLLLA